MHPEPKVGIVSEIALAWSWQQNKAGALDSFYERIVAFLPEILQINCKSKFLFFSIA